MSISQATVAGHGSVPKKGLTHANGRVLDPSIGRFLSVDPVYQAPTNSQSVNPYSYVMNNPLSLVDPSGYESTPDSMTIAQKTGGPDVTTVALGDDDKLEKLSDGRTVAVLADGTMIDVSSIKLSAGDGSGSATMTNSGGTFNTTVNTGNGDQKIGGGTVVLKEDGNSGNEGTASTNQTGQTQSQAPATTTTTATTPAAPVTTASPFNKAQFAKYLDDNADDESGGNCARAVRLAMDSAGEKIRDKDGSTIAAAGDYGPALAKAGAIRVGGTGDLKDYKHQKGDIAVFDKNSAHPYGHIAGFDGAHWVSDWVQHSFVPYTDQSNVPTYTIYRFPDSTSP